MQRTEFENLLKGVNIYNPATEGIFHSTIDKISKINLNAARLIYSRVTDKIMQSKVKDDKDIEQYIENYFDNNPDKDTLIFNNGKFIIDYNSDNENINKTLEDYNTIYDSLLVSIIRKPVIDYEGPTKVPSDKKVINNILDINIFDPKEYDLTDSAFKEISQVSKMAAKFIYLSSRDKILGTKVKDDLTFQGYLDTIFFKEHKNVDTTVFADGKFVMSFNSSNQADDEYENYKRKNDSLMFTYCK